MREDCNPRVQGRGPGMGPGGDGPGPWGGLGGGLVRKGQEEKQTAGTV